MDLQRPLGLALVFITHDLVVLRHMADRVMVIYLDRCVEFASKQAIYENPSHPYTQMLLALVPVPDPHVARGRRVAVKRSICQVRWPICRAERFKVVA